VKRIVFQDVGALNRELAADIDAAIHRVVSSGRYILGREVEAFESAWASYCEAAECVAVGNGFDALALALESCGIGPGDEVIVPSNTFIATWLAVSSLGARPVPVDPDENTMVIGARQIASAIGARTKVVLPVHLYGMPAPMPEIIALARRNDLLVVEDAAQAHGARLNGRRIGAHGDVACWSFYPAKNLGALGDAGAVTTDDSAISGRIRRLRNYGSSEHCRFDMRGRNSRMDPMQAAVLSAKLPYLDDWNGRRQEVARTYSRALRAPGLVLPAPPEGTEPVWHQYVVRTQRRDELTASLAQAGVDTRIHYPIPPHNQEAYADLGLRPESLPVASRLSQEILSLPIAPPLERGDVDYIIGAVRQSLATMAGSVC